MENQKDTAITDAMLFSRIGPVERAYKAYLIREIQDVFTNYDFDTAELGFINQILQEWATSNQDLEAFAKIAMEKCSVKGLKGAR